MKLKFECKGCGLCCRNIHLVEQLKDFHQGDGICLHLDLQTNLCKIYAERPTICNVDKSYDLFFSEIMTKEEYIKKNYEGCTVLWEKKKL